ncbi:MAG: DUF4358 domain-containing protein [Lachnospiraceae bacterium]|nr:DUF4358 domain-containing protein [Lachnospiraceae bacterium]
MKKLMISVLVGTAMLLTVGCNAEEKEVHDISINVGSTEEAAAEEEKSVDAAKLASDLVENIKYTDQISEVDLDTAKMFLNFADVDIEEAYIYESSGATAEEVVVLKCKDSDSASKAKTAFEQRVEEQTENFTDYVPEEVPKLKDAVIITSKEYAILSVSADSGKAKDIIEGAFK